MRQLFSALLESPRSRSAASTFTTWNGVLYMASGALLIAWPACVQALFLDPAFAGKESSLVRLTGMLLAVVGWLYFFGGRSGARAMVAATVVDRLTLVPIVLVSMALNGVMPHTLLSFAILDPTLALVAWRLLGRETR
jgi:hypothetical protein